VELTQEERDETHFKSMHPEKEVWFSKFVPCVLAGAGGTYAMCTYITCQNMKLLLEGLKLS
jgi:hypothetical protein